MGGVLLLVGVTVGVHSVCTGLAFGGGNTDVRATPRGSCRLKKFAGKPLTWGVAVRLITGDVKIF